MLGLGNITLLIVVLILLHTLFVGAVLVGIGMQMRVQESRQRQP